MNSTLKTLAAAISLLIAASPALAQLGGPAKTVTIGKTKYVVTTNKIGEVSVSRAGKGGSRSDAERDAMMRAARQITGCTMAEQIWSTGNALHGRMSCSL